MLSLNSDNSIFQKAKTTNLFPYIFFILLQFSFNLAQYDCNVSNIDGSFPLASSNSFLSPPEILPTAQ